MHHHRGQRAPDDAAVGGDVALVDPVGAPAPLDALVEQSQIRIQIVGVGDLLKRKGRQRLSAVAEHRPQRAVGAQERTVQADDGHPDRRVRQGQLKAPLSQQIHGRG
jgi:hypothetical protein